MPSIPEVRGVFEMESAYFNRDQVKLVRSASEWAESIVTDYYRIAPREWKEMPYEVRTLRHLKSSEIVDTALAHTLCYEVKRAVGNFYFGETELYRICLQDHRILNASGQNSTLLEAILLYVMTHELVHVVRFGRNMQEIDLPHDLRINEEMNVDKTTRTIMEKTGHTSRLVLAIERVSPHE